MNWKNKTVWITGASSGIGEAMARNLAEKGAKIILSSRSEDKLQSIKSDLPESEKHAIIPLDVSDPKSIEQSLQNHKSLIEQVNVLVNNAGISQRSEAWEATSESERLVMETNFFGAVALSKAVVPNMIKQNDGLIITLTSVVGKFGFMQRSSYAASKHALHGYFDSLRADLDALGKNIQITLVCPGRIKTNISINALESDGTRHGKMDPGQADGIDVNVCVDRIIRRVERGKAEIYIGKEQFLIYLMRFWPSLFRKIVTRFKPN